MLVEVDSAFATTRGVRSGTLFTCFSLDMNVHSPWKKSVWIVNKIKPVLVFQTKLVDLHRRPWTLSLKLLVLS
jgi:hypothetical protein